MQICKLLYLTCLNNLSTCNLRYVCILLNVSFSHALCYPRQMGVRDEAIEFICEMRCLPRQSANHSSAAWSSSSSSKLVRLMSHSMRYLIQNCRKYSSDSKTCGQGGHQEQGQSAAASSSRWGQVVCNPPCVSHTLTLEANRTEPNLTRTDLVTYIHTYIHTYNYITKYIIMSRPDSAQARY